MTATPRGHVVAVTPSSTGAAVLSVEIGGERQHFFMTAPEYKRLLVAVDGTDGLMTQKAIHVDARRGWLITDTGDGFAVTG